ncbi:MAG: methyltransferase domain-containing protein [Pseudomonadota bacterium]
MALEVRAVKVARRDRASEGIRICGHQDETHFMKRRYSVVDYTIRLNHPANTDSLGTANGGISDRAFPLFGMVWPSSIALAHLLLDRDITAQRILEVGCGLGLVSQLLKLHGADITAMDIHPIVGDLLARNCRLNRIGPIPFVAASWGDHHTDLGSFGLIVASDVLYEPDHVRTLPGFLRNHIHRDGEVIIVDPDRGQSDLFLDSMVRAGFDASVQESADPNFVGLIMHFVDTGQ